MVDGRRQEEHETVDFCVFLTLGKLPNTCCRLSRLSLSRALYTRLQAGGDIPSTSALFWWKEEHRSRHNRFLIPFSSPVVMGKCIIQDPQHLKSWKTFYSHPQPRHHIDGPAHWLIPSRHPTAPKEFSRHSSAYSDFRSAHYWQAYGPFGGRAISAKLHGGFE